MPMSRSTIFRPSGMLRVEADRELAVVQRVEVRRGVELLLSGPWAAAARRGAC